MKNDAIYGHLALGMLIIMEAITPLSVPVKSIKSETSENVKVMKLEDIHNRILKRDFSGEGPMASAWHGTGQGISE